MKYRKMIILTLTLLLLTTLCCTSALAAGGDVAGAVEQTWTEAAKQIKSVVEKVVFPALDMILAIAFFVKRPRHPLCLPDFQPDRAEIHLEYHWDLIREERIEKSNPDSPARGNE